MFAHTEEYGIPEGVRIVEYYNGGSREDEDQITIDNAKALGYLGIGGSDAHIVSHIGRCATRFPGRIESTLVVTRLWSRRWMHGCLSSRR